MPRFFTMKVELENDDFQHADTLPEMLEMLAQRMLVWDWALRSDAGETLSDPNGNTVGKWEIREE